MECTPVYLDSSKGPTRLLTRIGLEEYKKKGEKTDENWLQSLIFKNPELLPVKEFDEDFAPLIPIGREIDTGAGRIDVLYISPSGNLTIVETKLFKNPEQHRVVVAQVIDYAKEIARWNYDVLDKALIDAQKRKNEPETKSLECMVNPGPDLDSVKFQEKVNINLKNGEFLLLIVGDEVRENVALLTNAIQGAPWLNFKIGVIELHFHQIEENKDWPLLVFPHIVGRTVEVKRSTIKIQYKKEEPICEIEIPEETEEAGGKTNQEYFLQELPRDLRLVYEKWLNIWNNNKNIQVYWGKVGFSLLVPMNGKFITTNFRAFPDNLWLLTEKNLDTFTRLKEFDEVYQKYNNDVYTIPTAQNTLALGHVQLKHDIVTTDQLETILRATNNLIEDILKLIENEAHTK